MTGSGTSTVRSEDGTEIPVRWAYPGADAFEWIRDRSHWPDPRTPMDLRLQEDFWTGADRAWEEVGLAPPAMFYRFQFAGPFMYARMTPDPPERLAQLAPRYIEVARRYGNALGFWLQYCRPRIQQACRDLAGASIDAPLALSGETWGYGFHQTFTSLVLLGVANMRLTALLTESVGDDATLMAFEVTQGSENPSQLIDGEIWELASLARATPVVKRLLETNEHSEVLEALRAEPDAAAFVAALDALLDEHGSRSLGWDIVLPTWRERPDTPLALVRAQLESGGISPAELAAGTSARRAEATTRALTAIPESKHTDFQRIVAELDGYVSVREDRAYWQMVLVGEVRGLLLRKGASLVRTGRIDRPDDILFLIPEDFEGAGASDLRSLVSERRRAWEQWHQVIPPAQIGTPGEAPPAAESPRTELRGAAASRGQVTGPARILHSPEDGDRLRPGDILVCVMTTPAWTPLFSVVAGIITETGGPLSHPAITAREYGIPAVVAAKEATTRIRDGQIVSIDGASGLVSLKE